MDENGNVYIGSRARLQAIAADGTIRWTRQLGTGFVRSVALQSDGTVVAMVATGEVHGFDDAGEALWQRSLEDALSTTDLALEGMLVGQLDRLYLVARNLTPWLVALSPDAELLWVMQLSEEFFWLAPPAQAADGSIYLCMSASSYNPPAGAIHSPGYLMKISPNGDLLWQRDVDYGALTPAIAPDGTIWVARKDGVPSDKPRLHAFSPSGELLLSVYPSGGSLITAPPLIDPQGNVYLSRACGVTMVNPQGQSIWDSGCEPPPGEYMHIWIRPALDANQTVIAADLLGSIHGIRDGVVAWTVHRAQSSTTYQDTGAVAIGGDGTVLATGDGAGRLFALR